ncbi:MAG: tetratricopeptide repeat protein [Pirellulaceae bacterium]
MYRSHTLWTAALLTTGVAGGLIYNWSSFWSDDAAAEVSVEVDTTTIEGLPSEDLKRGLTVTDVSVKANATTIDKAPAIEMDSINQGDRLLLGGNTTGAYQQYKRFGKSLDPAISLRLALAAEQAGFQERSEQHYRDTINQASKGSIQQIWGLIGTARVWENQERYDEAISLLSELYLMYGNDVYPPEIRLPISQQLANCLQKRILSTVEESSATTTGNDLKRQLEFFWCDVKMEPILDDPSVIMPDQEPSTDGTDLLTIIQQPINDVELILVSVKSPMYPLSQLIADLERLTKMKFDVSAAARSTLAGRSIRIDAVALPVSLLLDQALGAHSLAWSQNQGDVQVVSSSEWKREMRSAYMTERTQRLQRQVQIQFPVSIERIAAQMHDANNSFLRGEAGAAADKYRSARELDPTGELNAKLYFNTATFQFAQGEHEAALNSYYLSLDQTLSPSLQAMAYSRIGEIEITQGRPERAVVAASRGLRMASDADDSNRTLIALAKAYLLMSDAYSANQVLFNHASSLTDERSQRLATVISTHARYEVIKPTHGLQNEGERLVLSLAALQPGDPRDFVDHLLVSRAFAAVGFRSKAVSHLSVAAETMPPGYWASRIPLELAEILLEAGELKRAAETLQAVKRSDNELMRVRALFLEAQINNDLGQPREVQAVCQRLLEMQLADVDQKRALRLLGKAYQKSGKHYSAALCFAGLLPEADETNDSLSSPTAP